jgi:NAD(P)-dependent dehydrogenase (short-subunit alcohol dehydrogenase family)
VARLAGQVAIVTGAGSGIGRAGAQLFAREGARVAVADIDRTRGEAVTAGIRDVGGEAMYAPCDVRDSASVRAMVDATVQRWGSLDVLYHNAIDVAFVNREDRCIVDLPEHVWDEMQRLALTGAFLCAKYAAIAMRVHRRGSIVLTATVDALIGQADLDAYTAAKGGVVAMTRSMAAGLARDGIRVNTLCPGFVATEGQMAWLNDDNARRAIEKLHLLPLPTPEDIAPFALFLASDEARCVTGGVFPVDAGYSAFKGGANIMAAIQGGYGS